MHACYMNNFTENRKIRCFELIFERFGTANLNLEFPIIFSNFQFQIVTYNVKMENSIQSSRLLQTTYWTFSMMVSKI